MMVLMLGMTACAPRAPLPTTDWQTSLYARPAGFPDRVATVSSPGDLYDRTPEDVHSGLSRQLLVCRVTVMGDVDLPPDPLVELSIGEREMRFRRTDPRRWDFSVGLVDLAVGERVGLRVTDDRLDGGEVLVQGTRRWNGHPMGWTQRDLGVRTSVRCRAPDVRSLEKELGARLKVARRTGRWGPVVAITGWADPRVDQMLRNRPPSTAID